MLLCMQQLLDTAVIAWRVMKYVLCTAAAEYGMTPGCPSCWSWQAPKLMPVADSLCTMMLVKQYIPAGDPAAQSTCTLHA